MTFGSRKVFLACLMSVFLSCVRLGAVAIPTGSTLYFPHIADGDEGGGQGVWTTDFIFVNNSSSTATGQLDLFDDNGAPLSLATSQGTNSVFNLTLQPEGQIDVKTSGGTSVVGGWATATFNHAVAGSATYALSTTAGGELVSVGVVSTYPASDFRSPADFRTGVALASPPSTGGSMTITITALDSSGNVAGTDTLSLASGHHVAKNLFDFIPALSPTFTGSIQIHSTDPMLALALGFKLNNSLYVSYSLPAMPYVAPAASYSGTYNLTTGPDAPASGSVSLTNIESIGTGLYTATINITFQGTTYSGPMLVNADPLDVSVSFVFQIPQFPNVGRALALQGNTNGFAGNFIDIGTGDGGTFALNPQ